MHVSDVKVNCNAAGRGVELQLMHDIARATVQG